MSRNKISAAFDGRRGPAGPPRHNSRKFDQFPHNSIIISHLRRRQGSSLKMVKISRAALALVAVAAAAVVDSAAATTDTKNLRTNRKLAKRKTALADNSAAGETGNLRKLAKDETPAPTDAPTDEPSASPPTRPPTSRPRHHRRRPPSLLPKRPRKRRRQRLAILTR